MHNLRKAFIKGFEKRAAQHGIDKNAAVKLAAEDGPFSMEQAASAAADEERLKALIYNRKNHLGHYLLNPFVGGPLTEMQTRLSRRTHQANSGKHGWGWTVAPYGQALGATPLVDHDAKRETIRKLLEKLDEQDTKFPGRNEPYKGLR
jgi:hypothetical protein